MSLYDKLKELPACPGVYLMKDSFNSIIYVGKSKNLKNRVNSYFHNSASHSPKVIRLVDNIEDFDIIITDTEFEAFLLECKLIREIKPYYNKKMKSPDSYVYVKIKTTGKYPEIGISSEAGENDGCRYFGPYSSKNTVARGLQGIKECFRILCTSKPRKASTCLNNSIGLCIGMCSGGSPLDEYRETLNEIIKLLEGSSKQILKQLEDAMISASEKNDFETAAKYRDYLSAASYLAAKVKVIEYTGANRNIAMLERIDSGCFKFFLIKGNQVLFSEKYFTGEFNHEELKQIQKDKITDNFKDTNKTKQLQLGRDEVDEAQIIYSYLKNKANGCKHIIIRKAWLKGSEKLSLTIDKLLP